MKFNSAFFSSLIILSSSLLTINNNAFAAGQVSTERWFEVEVILFKQLGDKNTLKEKFPDNITAETLPNYTKYFDLLTPYLQPDLTQLKQLLPSCAEYNQPKPKFEAMPVISAQFAENLAQITQITSFTSPNINEQVTAITEAIGTSQTSKENKLISASNNTVSEHAVTAELEHATSYNFDLDFENDALDKAIFSTDNLCIIAQNDIDALFDKQHLVDFNLDAFTIDALPAKLSTAGAHNESSPYLIADNSLLLKDIYQSIRWSKEFQPLLHFGWRQVGITESKAIPLKMFAGEHFQDKYQQALATYQKDLEQTQVPHTLALANNHDGDLSKLTSNDNLSIEANVQASQVQSNDKQIVINKLLSKTQYLTQQDNASIPDDALAAIIEKIDNQTIDDLITPQAATLPHEENALAFAEPPKKPLQPWYLDGFFKVHLDHYLYITADFNVFNQAPVNQVAEQLKQSSRKLINFNQNRRVITGEIHYFDHPYIGMIVQIRRFDPSKPADEAVSQAIK